MTSLHAYAGDLIFGLSAAGTIARVAAGLATGLFAGLLHFAGLWVNVRLLSSRGPLKAMALQLLRFGIVIGLFYALALLGASALLAGMTGLLLARQAVLWRLGEGA